MSDVPIALPVEFYQGESISIVLTITDLDDNLVDLSHYTGSFTVSGLDGTALITTDDDGEIAFTAFGIVTLEVAGGVTNDYVPGVYKYQATLVSPDGDVLKTPTGRFTLLEAVDNG
jgi:hypothetical protein